MSSNISKAQLIFVIGLGRSGTTLLQTMLDAHPHVVAPPESRFILLNQQRYKDAVWERSPEQTKLFMEDLRVSDKIRYFWDLDWELLERNLMAMPLGCRYPVWVKTVLSTYNSLYSKVDVRVVSDKNPQYAFFTGKMLDLFPEAKFIHLVRDPRANSYSFLKAGWEKYIENPAFRWRKVHQSIERLKNKQPDRFHTLNYEHLIGNTRDELTKICEFIGLEWNEEMHKYPQHVDRYLKQYLHSDQETSISASRKFAIEHIHKNLKSLPNPDLVNSWHEKLSRHDIDTVDSICGHFALRYGYEPEGLNRPGNETPLFGWIQYYFRWCRMRIYFAMPHKLRKFYFAPKSKHIIEKAP